MYCFKCPKTSTTQSQQQHIDFINNQKYLKTKCTTLASNSQAMGSLVSLSAFSRILICEQKINNQSRKHILSKQSEGNVTSEVLIDEIFPVGAHESVAKHQVQTAEQEVIGVHQVISNHAEITWNKVQIMSLSLL